MGSDEDVRVLAYQRLIASGDRLLAEASSGLAEYGLTITQFRALNILRVRGPLPQKEVAKYIWRTVATVGVLAASLQRMGLIDLRGDASDGRVVILALTEDGRELLERAVPQHIAQIQRVMSGLTEEDCQQLVQLIHKAFPEE